MYEGSITSVRIVLGDKKGVSHDRVFTLKIGTKLVLLYLNHA